MIGQKLVAREAEVLRTLGAMHQATLRYALVGGYAVDAYSPLPRYSVDCDIVIGRAAFKAFASLLKKGGYGEPRVAYKNPDVQVETWEFAKKAGADSATVDLYVGGFRCRQTGAIWRAAEIQKTSESRRVVGINDSVISNVASREMLIAMKLHSARDPDLRDVCMLGSGADWGKVLSLCSRGSKARLSRQLKRANEIMSGEGFGATLKATFGTREDQQSRLGRISGNVAKLAADVRKSAWMKRSRPRMGAPEVRR